MNKTKIIIALIVNIVVSYTIFNQKLFAIDLLTKNNLKCFLSKKDIDSNYFSTIIKDSLYKKWENVSYLDLDFVSDYNYLIVAAKLPDIKISSPTVLVNLFSENFEVFLLNKRIYKDSSGFYGKKCFFYHKILLSDNYRNKILFIKIPLMNEIHKSMIYSLKFGNVDEINNQIIIETNNSFRKRYCSIIISAILIFSGLLSLFLFFYRWNKKDYAFLFFSLFAIFSISEDIDVRTFYSFFNVIPDFLYNFEVVSRYIIVLSSCLFVYFTFGDKQKKLMFNVFIFNLVYTIISLILLFLRINPISSFLTISVAFTSIISVGFMIYVITKSDLYKKVKKKIYFKIFSILALIIILFTLLSVGFMEYHHLAPLNLGILAISFAMISVMAEKYSDSENQINKYLIELEINKNELLKLQKTNIQAQYDTLINQINPHFLFNCLSALSTLSYPNPKPVIAKQFIDEFSKFFRYILDIKDKTVIQLDKELSFIESYYFLQKIRFEDKLDLKITIDKKFYSYLISPLTLQNLIETAIKINKSTKENPLCIEIFIENNYIILKNNMQLLYNFQNIKLDDNYLNIINKYDLLTEYKPEFIYESNISIAKIPLLNDDLI